MRVVGLCEREKELVCGIPVGLLLHGAQEGVVAAVQHFLGRLHGFFGELQREVFALQLVVPELVRLGFVLGPGSLLAVDHQRAVALESEFLRIQPSLDLRHAAFGPLFIEIEDLVGRGGVAEQDVVVESAAVFGHKSVDVLLGKNEVCVVERLQVAKEGPLGEFVVQLVAAVMELLQDAPDGTGDLARVRRSRADSRRRGNQKRERCQKGAKIT